MLYFYIDLRFHFREQCISSEFSDITVKIADEEIYSHKIILAKNDVFKSMFVINMLESYSEILTIIDCDMKTIKTLLKFLYTREVANEDCGFIGCS